MKNLLKTILLISAFSAPALHAQYSVDEDNAAEGDVQFGSSQITFDLKRPVELYRLQCADPQYVKFPNGEPEFRKNLMKELRPVLSDAAYYVNGNFNFIFEIDKEGYLKNLTIKPEVENSKSFFQDVKYAVKKLNYKWIPAQCDGTPVDSKIRLRVNFATENFEMF